MGRWLGILILGDGVVVFVSIDLGRCWGVCGGKTSSLVRCLMGWAGDILLLLSRMLFKIEPLKRF